MKSILFFLVGGILLLSSCSVDNINEQGMSTTTEPGTYIVGINLNTELPLTKNVTYDVNGDFCFDTTYPYDVIYLHNGDNSIAIPVGEVSECGDGCKGFSYKVCIGEDGGATITPLNADGSESGSSLSLDTENKIYFSSWLEKEWNVESFADKTVPHDSEAKLYKREKDKNVELFRSSSQSLSIDDLKESGQLDIKRVCCGFSFFCVFTDRADNELTEEDFRTIMGASPDKFKIQIYLGAAFTGTYDIENEKGDGGNGYYASADAYSGDYGNANAVQLRGEIESPQYGTGYGYATLEDNYLIAPVNEGEILNAYIYITKTEEDGSTKTIFTDAKAVIANANEFGRMGADIDIRELAAAFEQYENLPETASTRSLSGPYRFEAKTLKTYISY